MTIITPKIKREPLYKNTTVCGNCDEEYDSNVNWDRGFNLSEGTETPTFYKISSVEHGHCPICDFKQS
jgi:hypothetical protein